MEQLTINKKLDEIEHRLDKIDDFYDILVKEFMQLEASEFKCNICEKMNLQAHCMTTPCPRKTK